MLLPYERKEQGVINFNWQIRTYCSFLGLHRCATIIPMLDKTIPGRTIKIPSRSEIIKSIKEREDLIAGVFPIHYPRELLRAFGIHPIEIWGPPRIDPTAGVSHLQPYVCSIVRNAMAFQQSGGLDIVDLLLVPHACDSLQGLGSVLLDFIQPQQPIIPFYLPRADGGVAKEYLIAELKTLYIQLKIMTGKTPSDDELLDAIVQEERYDEKFSELYIAREELPLSTEGFYKLVRSREYVPGEDFVKLSDDVLDHRTDAENSYTGIILSGIVPEPMDLFTAVEDFGGRVVADDLACCGRRRYSAGKSQDPFERMAERLLSGPPDWNKGNSIGQRIDYLVEMIDRNKAKGILFYTVKFCEPELFDTPILRKALQSKGVPSLILEFDINDPLTNQALTRIEAFMEMIG